MKEFFKKTENLFVILCLIVGLIFIAINPPFLVSDENSHFFKMYSITEGTLNFKKYTYQDGKTYAVSTLPQSVVYIAKDANDFIFNYNKKHSFEETRFMSKIQLNREKTSNFIYFIPSYGPLSYMPGILVLEAMKLLNVPPLWMMYILRVVSLLTYIFICYWAIRIVPVKKWLFLMSALLPILVYSAGGISTDGIVASMCIFYTAYMFNLAFNDEIGEISRKQYIIMTLTIFYITLCKFPYGTLALLLFVIPREKFSSKFSKNKTLLLTFLGIFIITFACYFYNSILTKNLSSPNHEIVSAKEALIFAIKNPGQIIYAVINATNKNYMLWYTGTIALFGWSDTSIPIFGYYLTSFLLILISILKNENEPQSEICAIKNKLIYFSIPFLFTIITMAICYLLFSYNDFSTIRNMQGRYLAPLTPLFCSIFATNISVKYNWIKISSIVFYIILICICVINIINRFY